jgi:glutaredoxin-like protein
MRCGIGWFTALMFRRESPTPVELTEPITVYWRPGCGFCGALITGLRKQDVPFEQVNIWDDDEAAAYVRSVARGNETVPTVRVGSIGMVNPSVQQVLAAATAPRQSEPAQ